MRCEQVQSLLSAYADGELPRTVSVRVAEHLGACESCAAESRSLVRLVVALRELPEEAVPAGLHDGIMDALTTAQPSFWQRLGALTIPLHSLRYPAFGAATAVLAVLAFGTAPLYHARLPHRDLAESPPVLPSRPISGTLTGGSLVSTALPAPKRESVPLPKTLTPPADTGVMRDVFIAKAADPAPKLTVAAATRRPERSKTAAKVPQKPARGRSAPAPMPTFDPLATVIDTTNSPAEPQMAHVVVVDTPPVMPSADLPSAASVAGGNEITTASSARDDLASLRQRLATEQFQLPAVRVPSKPSRRKGKGIPLIHGEF